MDGREKKRFEVIKQKLQMLRQKLDYIHCNPVKRGYVAAPEHWLYSSARNYMLGDHSIIELDLLPV